MSGIFYLILLFLIICIGLFLWREIVNKNIHIWLPSYAVQKLRPSGKNKRNDSPIDIIFCVVDHFEPIQNGSTASEEWNRINTWTNGFPTLADKHTDTNGRPVQHTWFYPGEAYVAEYLEKLCILCRNGYGDVELHHHHSYQTSESLRALLNEAVNNFAKHGALTIERNGETEHVYGFIHGNMALDNSRFDDRYCGVNNELILLKETGCYADFSAPTAPCRSQPSKVNAIYYAFDDPDSPKSHSSGIDVGVGRKQAGDLMIIQGPLALNWSSRKYGLFPRIDNAEVLRSAPGTPDRIDRWVEQNIHVSGAPNWVFVKISCHGAQDENFPVLLGESADEMYAYLESRYRDCDGFRLHYVTAREMYNIVKAAENGMCGNPFDFKDYIIPPYLY
jgi:hypothetical protein